MVYKKEVSMYECVHSYKSAYKSIYSIEEREVLIRLIKKVFNRDFTNEKSVRLDGMIEKTETVILLSLAEFYDFLVTNFILLNREKLLCSANEKERGLLKRIIDKVQDDSGIESLDDVIRNDFLSNIVAVSCLIKDKFGKVLLTRRNNNVGIANGFLSVSATGSVDGEDFKTLDPFNACCKRELYEEMGFVVDSECSVKLKAIVCGEKKLQPIALMDVTVEDINCVIDAIKGCSGFSEENSKYYVCDIEQMRELIYSNQYRITEAGLAHMESLL